MAGSGISQLGFVELRVKSISEWEQFGRAIGVQCSRRENANSNEMLLRIDERDYRLWLKEDEADALGAVGWEASSAEAFTRIVTAAREWGLDVEECDTSYSNRRRYSRLARFRDPAGMPVEIGYAPLLGPSRFEPSRPISGFKADNLGLGHLFAYVPDIRVMEEFYTTVLGFRTSDYIEWPEADIDAVFLRCNARHHSIAFAESESAAPCHLEHVMLETYDVDDLGLTVDSLQSKGFLMGTSFGRHINDRMLSFYASTPSGFWLEYGCGAVSIENEQHWEVKRYSNGHTWGHATDEKSKPRLLPFA
ncbi:VOC family protein [Mycolicibacterium sp. D5.8-2]|uniref:VOC family protein n=1 Tax=Mycolicibacterium sp. D5.8-2 TaxID=3085903 RepID=UPI00298C4FAD|nr:VOC family protein [Mycolicibacterium sp. D5.8-2]MDW5615158.1 VOC family protein [Mycolicibacterium sp. D5.8-2]